MKNINIDFENYLAKKYPDSVLTNISTGGFSQVVKIEFKYGKNLVAKINSPEFPLQGELEFLNYSTHSPKVVDFSISGNFLIMEFLEGMSFKKNDPLVPDTIYYNLGKILKDNHQITSAYYKSYSVFREGKKYIKFADLLNDLLSLYLENTAFLEYSKLKAENLLKIQEIIFKIEFGQPVLTHGDIYLENILIRGNDLFMIDPSSERFMDKHWDIAMFKWHIYHNEKKNEILTLLSDGYSEDFTRVDNIQLSICELFVCLSLEYNNFIRKEPEVWRSEQIEELINQIII